MKNTYFKKIINASPEHIFKLAGVRLYGFHDSLDRFRPARDYYEFGEISLINTVTNIRSNFTIWGEDVDDLYVCLPSGEVDEDGEDTLDDYTLEDLGIQVSPEGTGFIYA